MNMYISISSEYFKMHQKVIQQEIILRKRYGRGGEPDMKKVEQARQALGPIIHVLEQKLSSQSAYFSGSEFGLSDICLMPEMDMLIESGHGDLVSPCLQQWWNAVSQRPAWEQVLQISHDWENRIK